MRRRRSPRAKGFVLTVPGGAVESSYTARGATTPVTGELHVADGFVERLRMGLDMQSGDRVFASYGHVEITPPSSASPATRTCS